MRRRLLAIAVVLAAAFGSIAAAAPAEAREQIDLCDYFRNMLICGEGPLGP